MEIPDNTALPERFLVRALDIAQRELNRRVFARRIAGAIAMGLILCFPILIVMLYFHMTVLEIIFNVTALNGMVIAVRLLTETWANGVDAALFLEQQYNAPGLFITAADVLANAAQETGRHDAKIIFDAANRCQTPPAQATKILLSTSADQRIWAANGLLFITLLVTAGVGQAVMAHAGRDTGTEGSSKTGRVTAARAANSGRNSHLSAQKPQISAMEIAPRESRSQLFAQHRATDAIKQLQASITHLLKTAKIKPHRRPADHGTGNDARTDKDIAEALQAQLLAAARLPGVGPQTKTMLLAAAHAIHASSKGNFVPLLRKINQQLERYLATGLSRQVVMFRHSEFGDDGDRASITRYAAVGANQSNVSDRAGDSGDAVITDIPSSQSAADSVELRWGRGSPADHVKIPVRYRMAVERYFSYSPTPNARSHRTAIK